MALFRVTGIVHRRMIVLSNAADTNFATFAISVLPKSDAKATVEVSVMGSFGQQTRVRSDVVDVKVRRRCVA